MGWVTWTWFGALRVRVSVPARPLPLTNMLWASVSSSVKGAPLWGPRRLKWSLRSCLVVTHSKIPLNNCKEIQWLQPSHFSECCLLKLWMFDLSSQEGVLSPRECIPFPPQSTWGVFALFVYIRSHLLWRSPILKAAWGRLSWTDSPSACGTTLNGRAGATAASEGNAPPSLTRGVLSIRELLREFSWAPRWRRALMSAGLPQRRGCGSAANRNMGIIFNL